MSVWLVGSTGQSEGRDRAGLVQYLLVLRTSFPASESQLGWGRACCRQLVPSKNRCGQPTTSLAHTLVGQELGSQQPAGLRAASTQGHQCQPHMQAAWAASPSRPQLIAGPSGKQVTAA